jgi:hypothetical protein
LRFEIAFSTTSSFYLLSLSIRGLFNLHIFFPIAIGIAPARTYRSVRAGIYSFALIDFTGFASADFID